MNYIENVISPYDEVIAYETLWALTGMTEKKMSEYFNRPILPSKVIKNLNGLFERDEISKLRKNVEEFLTKKSGQFSISIYNDFQYPEKLRDAKYPVELFYYKGNLELINSKCVSIVGTREPSQNGIKNTRALAKTLVEEGYTIVSGLAKGIDTVAHEAAINSGGNTIAVIGTPLDRYYPKENKELQEKIASGFLLVSQFPFYRHNQDHFHVQRTYFPRRNVLMSAMTEATFIIEAGETSGTLIQARAALNQKRKLFILDDCFDNEAITWPAKYEKQGAVRLVNFNKIKDLMKKQGEGLS